MIITAPVHGQDNIDVEGCYSVHRASAVLPLVGLTCDGVGRDKQKTDSRSDSCPATRRDSYGLASARPAGVNTPHSCPGLALQFRDSEFAGFSFKNPAPTFFNHPSCGVPRVLWED